jgi:hypothetical protein
MNCRRIRRELIELFRFGGLDLRSAPHLDHLAGCRACRDEVGFDRALVRQLRVALAERVGETAPSPDAWATILARAQVPERGLRAWLRGHSVAIAARLRTATAVSAVAFAGLIAAGTSATVTGPSYATTSAASELLAERFESGPARPVAPVFSSAADFPATYLGGRSSIGRPEMHVSLGLQYSEPRRVVVDDLPEFIFVVRPGISSIDATATAVMAESGQPGEAVDGALTAPAARPQVATLQ